MLVARQNIKEISNMCLLNSNIIVEENKEVNKNSDLTYEDRVIIEDMLRSKKKYSLEDIANKLGRNKSIISREISRNSENKWYEKWARYRKVYSAMLAQGKYELRKKNAGRKSKILKDRALKQYIENRILKDKWSPEEVAGYIKKHNIKFSIQPSFQLIYYWIEKKYLNIKPLDLVHKAKLKNKNRKEEKEHYPKHIEKSIHNRPQIINENKEFGHWELDCVEGLKENKKTYMTILERMTKKYIVIEMESHTNNCIKKAIDSLEEKYGKYFKKIFKSMTTDNGHEFLNYEAIEESIFEKEKRTEVYYADPYSSWQKGMNENCNGILRRFIPKGTDLEKISIEKLEQILYKINHKPRKILGYTAAEELFQKELEKIIA
jgi:IS30 family transposase